MKKRLQISRYAGLLLLLASPLLHAQWQNGLWVGKQANNFIDSGMRVNFNSGVPVVNFGYPLSALEGSATISDTDGELLFFAGANTIWNKNSQVMLNGTDLIGGDNSSTQFGIFVPKPGNPNIYYLFNVSSSPNTTFASTGLIYSEIDLSLDGGLGGVTANKNIVLDANVGVEKITGVYHADGENVWVITHRMGGNEFVAFLVTDQGVSTTPVVSGIGSIVPAPDPNNETTGFWGGAGQLKVSPDGSKLAFTILDGPNKGVDLYDFNSETGAVTNFIHLDGFSGGWPYGIEFSPNSRFLYTCNPIAAYSNGGTIDQYDVTMATEAAVKNSKQVITTITSPWAGNGGLVLGANGKIYSKDVGGEATNVINYPNNAGSAAGFQLAVLPMANGIGMPTFNQTYLESGIVAEEACEGEVTFSLLRIPDVTSTTWTYGDPASGPANTSTTGVHTYSVAGTYTVTAQITSNGAVQTATTQINVVGPDGGATTPGNLALCDDGTGMQAFDLSAQTPVILGNLDPDTFTITYYTSEANAHDEVSPITTESNFTSAGQTIFVRVENSETGCHSILQFGVEVSDPPLAPQVPDLQSCDAGASDGFSAFDLTQQEAALMAGQPGVEITYYTSEADAESHNNPVATPATFINTVNPQTIYVTIENAAGCHSHVEFEVEVIPIPLAAQLPALEVCSTGSMFTSFDLTVQEATLLQGQPNVSIGYFISEADAEADINPIAAPESFTNTSSTQVIYTRVSGTACYVIVPFTITVFDTPPILTGLELTSCIPFDLLSITPEAGNGVTLSFYTAEQDAIAETNAVTNTAAYQIMGDHQVLYVRSENENGCWAVSELHLMIGDCNIPKGISPNGDELNDSLDLSSFDVTSLSIFNRYGQEVFSFANYTDQWVGQDKKGNKLPTGTYYYAIQRKNGENRTGWIYINSTN